VTGRGRGVRSYRLLGADGRPYPSAVPGTLGGHRRGRLYGRLDCPAARRAIARGGYVTDRVFFADEATAIAAGYRPCAACLPAEYARWKSRRDAATPPRRAPPR
jgi:Metal binding domain of Ada